MESRVSAVPETDSFQQTQFREKRLRDSCKDFGSIMISYMMKAMRQGGSGGEEQSFASGVYQDMLDERVAKVVGNSGRLGVGDMLYSQLDRMDKKHASPKHPGEAAEAQKAQVSLNKTGNSAE